MTTNNNEPNISDFAKVFQTALDNHRGHGVIFDGDMKHLAIHRDNKLFVYVRSENGTQYNISWAIPCASDIDCGEMLTDEEAIKVKTLSVYEIRSLRSGSLIRTEPLTDHEL